MNEKWRKVTGERVKLSVIGSYRAGGEAAIADKMAIGGVDGCLITAVGLSRIDKSIGALSLIPMVYRSLEELDYVVEKLGPDLGSRLEQKGFIVLLWADIGWVRHFSVQPFKYPDDLKKMKVFSWVGDQYHDKIMRDWGINVVALETSDILPGLSTGMINEVAATPFNANAGQFASVAKYMVKVNWAPLIGAVLIRKQSWEKIPAEFRPELLKIAAEIGKEIREKGRKESDEAVEVMKKKHGLNVYIPPPDVEEEWRRVAQSVYGKIRGTMVPADMFDRVEVLLREYRSARGIK
jgi:TRAP-type C4-dicarboxylate transport system substrate-binding protein